MKKAKILWWGKGDPEYSRNRIVRKCLKRLGHEIVDFRPNFSQIGNLEYYRQNFSESVDVIWVPCFRQRDFFAAYRVAKRFGLKLIFDPLISSYDKRVYEHVKYPEESYRAKRILKKEHKMFSTADIVIADTEEHKNFFCEILGTSPDLTHVVPVGAEESLFTYEPEQLAESKEVLFYGSFVPLQGADKIIEAAKLKPEIHWTLLGAGKGLDQCQALAQGVKNVTFEPWVAYKKLPERIRKAQLILGIFGDTPKASRVIPNKVYQALACGRPVVTRNSSCYSRFSEISQSKGCLLVEGQSENLANTVENLIQNTNDWAASNLEARRFYEKHFSEAAIQNKLQEIMSRV